MRPRVGGMAFGNGVLMRSKGCWAWARSDGTVRRRARSPRCSIAAGCCGCPLLRSLVALAEMLVFAVRLQRRNGLRPNLRLLVWLCPVGGRLRMARLAFLRSPGRRLARRRWSPSLSACCSAWSPCSAAWAYGSGATTAPSTRRSTPTRPEPTLATSRRSHATAASTTAAAPTWSPSWSCSRSPICRSHSSCLARPSRLPTRSWRSPLPSSSFAWSQRVLRRAPVAPCCLSAGRCSAC